MTRVVFSDANFRLLHRAAIAIVVLFVFLHGRVLPVAGRTDAVLEVGGCFVEENAVLDFIAQRRLVDYETLVVLRAGHHGLVELAERGEHTGEEEVHSLPVHFDVVAQHNDVVDVRAYIRRNVRDELAGDDREDVEVAPVHCNLAREFAAHKALVEEQVVEDGKGRLGVAQFFLAPFLHVKEAGRDFVVVFVVDEALRNVFVPEGVGPLCCANANSALEVAMVAQNILGDGGFPRAASSYDEHDRAVSYLGRVPVPYIDAATGVGVHFSVRCRPSVLLSAREEKKSSPIFFSAGREKGKGTGDEGPHASGVVSRCRRTGVEYSYARGRFCQAAEARQITA